MKQLMNPAGFKKRKRGERVFRFRTFCEPGHPVEFNGPFRDNIRKLLEFARVETKLCAGMNTWSFQLELNRHPPVCISLFVIEEPIEKSVSRHCNYCQYVEHLCTKGNFKTLSLLEPKRTGWGHHMICNGKFHFVVPSKETAVVMTVCSSYESEDAGPPSTMTAEISNFIELRGHLLHGVLHSNGFGHLISINGIEKGSKLAGNEFMDLWDRICTGLRARKVSINDIAKKRSMDLRLIHGVAFGEPWFGRWGYRFGRGSFGVTLPMYQKAIEAVQSIPLCLFIQSFASSYQEILVIFTKYQSISGNSLITLGHIFRFMQELKDRLPPDICHLSSSNIGTGITVAETTCRWSPKRVEMATRVIIEALMKAEFRWVSRQEVRDAARAYIGDTGLLDFVLKSLGNQIVGNFVVRRTVNPVTKVLEYCLEDISTTVGEGFYPNDPMMKSRYHITRTQLMKDLFYLYKFIFTEPNPSQNGGVLSMIPIAVRIILDSKYLIKDYKGELFKKTEVGYDENLKLLCTVSLKKDGDDQEIKRIKKALEKPSPYDDLIILPPHATFRELKMEVERSFKDMYWGLKSFVAESVLDLKPKESDLVLGLEPAGFSIVVSGRIVDREIDIEGIFEGKNHNLIIDCPCGAKEDDGERMITCDICEVRQHMRCVQISNMENVPDIFLCSRCEHDIVLRPDLP